MADGNDTTNCSLEHATIIAALGASSGLVSTLACIGVVALIFLLKKHYFFSQRLILYLSIASLLNSIATALRYQRLGETIRGLCVFTAFFDQTTSWAALIAIACITVNLLLLVVFRKQTTRLEPLFFVTIFVFPLTFNWIPFVKDAYGVSGAWCWIRITNEEDCSAFLFGTYLSFILWWVPLYVILAILIVIYVAIVYHMRSRRRTWDGKYDPESAKLKKMMEKEVRPLLWYPLIYFVINIFPLINRIHDIATEDPKLALWILHALFSPLKGGFIAVAFTLDRETLRRLNCAQLRAAVWKGSHQSVHEYPAGKPHGYTDSFQHNGTGRATRYSGVVQSSPSHGPEEEEEKETSGRNSLLTES